GVDAGGHVVLGGGEDLLGAVVGEVHSSRFTIRSFRSQVTGRRSQLAGHSSQVAARRSPVAERSSHFGDATRAVYWGDDRDGELCAEVCVEFGRDKTERYGARGRL